MLCGSTSWVQAASSYIHLASRDLWLHDKNVLLPNQTQPDKEEQTFSELHLIMLKTFLLDGKVSHFDSSHIDVFLMNKSINMKCRNAESIYKQMIGIHIQEMYRKSCGTMMIA